MAMFAQQMIGIDIGLFIYQSYSKLTHDLRAIVDKTILQHQEKTNLPNPFMSRFAEINLFVFLACFNNLNI